MICRWLSWGLRLAVVLRPSGSVGRPATAWKRKRDSGGGSTGGWLGRETGHSLEEKESDSGGSTGGWLGRETGHSWAKGGQAPKVLILHANGTNRDRDAALACELAGGRPEIVHINQLIAGEKRFDDYGMLVVPGGFSYGDDLGAGVLWATDLRHQLGTGLRQFVDSGRPVLGICNGFQVLVKSGLFAAEESVEPRPFTLTYNQSGHFECRWVYLENNPASPSIFTKNMSEPIYCPVAHGEGRFATVDQATADYLQANNLIALTYGRGGSAAYPENPNGSEMGIAAICNQAGNMMGLMPHPENHVFPWQHPRHHRGERGMSGLVLFENGVRYAAS